MTLALWALAGRTASAWGPTAHRLANQWALETLPPDLRGFFEANRQFLIDHASDPDEAMKKDRYERARHYIYLDKYGFFPYRNLPHNYQNAVERYGSSRIGRDGLLSWNIGEYSLRLTNAFRAHNWEDVKELAEALGHYVADAHDPLHTTQNYDGQLTEEKGLADRFEIRMVDRYCNFFMFTPEDAAKIDDPTEYAFQMALEANTWVERVIFADRRARQGPAGYNEDYFDRFYSQAGSIAMREINGAARDIGSYWYTAWLNAGAPSLPSR